MPVRKRCRRPAQESALITSQEQLGKITDIIAQLDEQLQHPDNDNRRRQPRIAMRTQMTIILLSGINPSPVAVFSRNISASGMGFVCRRMFRPEERIAIPLRVPKLPAKLVLARTTFGRYIGSGFYEMGAEFLECVSDLHGENGTSRIPNHWLLGAGQVKTPHNTTPAAAAAAPAAAPAAPAAPAPAK